MATHAVSEKPYELAYEASIRAIDNQAATVESLRSRAGTILAATALVTSFLGGQAITRGASSPLHVVSFTIALQYESMHEFNARQIRVLVLCFRLAIACLVGEVGFWLTVLARGGL